MPPIPFSVEVRGTADCRTLVLQGDIDRPAEAGLAQACGEALAGGATTLLLDFSGVAYINSTGIALLIGLVAAARQATCRVQAVGLSDHYRAIFEITRLTDYVEIVLEPPASTSGLT